MFPPKISFILDINPDFRAKKRKHKHKDKKEKDEKRKLIVDDEAIAHGGWWKATKFEEITGSVAIEFGNRTYIKSLDNGTFTLGPPHDEGNKNGHSVFVACFLISLYMIR